MTLPLTTTREYFLQDKDLKAALGLDPKSLILEVKRHTGAFHHKRGSENMDLFGVIVTVREPTKEGGK